MDRYFKVAVIIIFIVIGIIGFYAVSDSAIHVDDPAQWRHSRVAWKYINEHIFNRHIPELDASPNLNEYNRKNYGTAIQMPMAFVEDLFNYQLSMVKVYKMRYAFVFMYYFISLICFYFLCKRLFSANMKTENSLRFLAICGVMMLFLFPRFFAGSVGDVKNLSFVSFFIIALFFMVKFLQEHRGIIPCIFFCIFSAIATNVRMAGLLLIAAILVFMIIEDIFTLKNLIPKSENRKLNNLSFIFPYILILVVFTLLFYFITPAMWNNPLEQLNLMLTKSVDYDIWDRDMVFNGHLITRNEIPWYYLPIWMGITIPVYILFFFVVGIVALIVGLYKGKLEFFIRDRLLWMLLFLFLIPTIMVMSGLVGIYMGWRHVYFLFVPLVLISLYGVIKLHEVLQRNQMRVRTNLAVPMIIAAGLLGSAFHLGINHPYQGTLFNAIGTPVGKYFDRSDNNVRFQGYLTCLEYLLENYPDQDLSIESAQYMYDMIDFTKASEEKKARIIDITGTEQSGDFYWESYRYFTGELHERDGYREVFSIWIDYSFILGTLFISDDSTLKELN